MIDVLERFIRTAVFFLQTLFMKVTNVRGKLIALFFSINK